MKDHRIRIYLESDERIIVPKHATIKYIRPHIPTHNHLFPPSITIPVKVSPSPTKNIHNKVTLPSVWVKSSGQKIFELFKPSITLPPISAGLTSYDGHDYDVTKLWETGTAEEHHPNGQLDDIKPVTEEISEDIQYDFRTQTHHVPVTEK